jgi:hypothetical protein
MAAARRQPPPLSRPCLLLRTGTGRRRIRSGIHESLKLGRSFRHRLEAPLVRAAALGWPAAGAITRACWASSLLFLLLAALAPFRVAVNDGQGAAAAPP